MTIKAFTCLVFGGCSIWAAASGPVNLKFSKVDHHLFVEATVAGKKVPLELNMALPDSRIDPYLSGVTNAKELAVTVAGEEIHVPVKAAMGPSGFYQVNKQYSVGYLGQNAFKGQVLLFAGSDQVTLFSPQDWNDFRDQSGLPLNGTVAIPLVQLTSGLFAVPVKSMAGKTFKAELQIGGALIRVTQSNLPNVWLGLSKAEALSGAGTSVVGGLYAGSQILVPYGIDVLDNPVDRYDREVSMAIPDPILAGQAFAIDFSKNELILPKLSGIEVLAYMLEGQGILSCHVQNGKLYGGDDDNPSPQKQPYLSPISHIGALKVSDLAKWVLGQTPTEVQYFEKAFDSILAAQNGSKPLKVTFDTPSGPVQVSTK